MSFFLLYLLIHGPIMAASLGSFSGGSLIVLSIASIIYFGVLGASADMSKYDGRPKTISQLASEPLHAGLIKWIKRSFFVLLAVFLISKAVPDQRSMAIIVGGGVTYEVITSDAGKRIGGKVAGALEKKIEEILSNTEEEPAPKVKGKEA